MKFLIFLLLLSIVIFTSCRTTRSTRHTRKKNSKDQKVALKINGENISSRGVEIIREGSNSIVESNVDITQYEDANNGITEHINDEEYQDNQDNSDTFSNLSSSDTMQKGNVRKSDMIFRQKSKKNSKKETVQIPTNNTQREDKSKSDENFAIAKSEMIETPFAPVDDNRFASTTNDTISKTDRILKKIKTLCLLGNNNEALVLLKNNWGLFTNSEKNSTNTEKHPLAEAFFLKGKINMGLAEKTADDDAAKEKYQTAMKSFYIVLSKYNARRCPFSSEAIKLFRKCKNKYYKIYQVKVGFPPEF